MLIIIAGGGKVGYYLGKALLSTDQEVVLVERERRKAEYIRDEFGDFVNGVVICGDACDPMTLQTSGVERAKMVVAVTGDDEDNLVICQLAKKKFGVQFTLARVNNPKNEEIFLKLGIDATASATQAILSVIEREVAYKGVMSSFCLLGGVEVLEIPLREDSPAAGKTLKELILPSDSIIGAVVRGGTVMIPDGNTMLLAGDIAVAIAKEDNFEKVKEIIRGGEPDASGEIVFGKKS
jgi:trk system potassium uptake protein TrkA